nr:hypothetical protein [Nocardia miyunensis]
MRSESGRLDCSARDFGRCGSSDAEGVPSRVDQHAESIAAGLMRCERGTEADYLLFDLRQIADAEVEVEATWCGGIRPRGWLMVGYPLEVQTHRVTTGQHNQIRADRTELPTQEALIDRASWMGFGQSMVTANRRVVMVIRKCCHLKRACR